MKQAEVEQGIRNLCHVWARERGIEISPNAQPSFAEFYSWLEERHSAYLNFVAQAGVRYMVEMWFDREFKQGWRN